MVSFIEKGAIILELWRVEIGRKVCPIYFVIILYMMFLGIVIIRTEKCWPNSPTYSTDVGVLRGWGRAQITVRHFGSRGKKGWETLQSNQTKIWYDQQGQLRLNFVGDEIVWSQSFCTFWTPQPNINGQKSKTTKKGGGGGRKNTSKKRECWWNELHCRKYM